MSEGKTNHQGALPGYYPQYRKQRHFKGRSRGGIETKTPVKIVDIVENGDSRSVVFYPERLEKILNDHKHKKVAVLAVAGAFRTGKSFLLSYIVKLLKSKNLDDDSPLKGWFQWQAGTKTVTTGIDVWGEPIPVTLTSGEEIVVLLLDTQGTFSHDSTHKECTIIFALSLLLSSTLIYNIPTRITNNDLEHLQMWMEYGKLAAEQRNNAPFQGLMFLVRDWQNYDEYKYGIEGGEELLRHDMQIESKQLSELSSLREDIKKSFEPLSCFLLPHIGLDVVGNKEFDGTMKDPGVRQIFKKHFKDLLRLLRKEYIAVKTVNGTPLYGKDLVRYFKEYSKLFEKDEIPEPMSTFTANANVHNSLVVERCLEIYIAEMEKILKYAEPSNTEELKSTHEKALTMALSEFAAARVMGSQELITKHEECLKDTVLGKYTVYKNDLAFKTLLKKQVCYSSAQDRHESTLMKIFKEGYIEPDKLEPKHEAIIKDVVQEFEYKWRKIDASTVATSKQELEIRLRKRLTELGAYNQPSLSQKLAHYGTRIATVGSSTWAGATGGAEIGAVATLNPVGATAGAVVGGIAGAAAGIGMCYKAKQ